MAPRDALPLLPSKKLPGPALLLLFVALGLIGLAAFLGPIPQDPAYHAFADQRRILGIPNFADVVSNAAFALAGALGLRALAGPAPGLLPSLRPAYAVFFAGALLIAAGSAYYHLAPSNPTLVWDRLPMTLSFVSFFAIVLGEHASERLARRLLVPLLVLGAGSVVFWAVSERLGRGDLRPYLLVQALAIVLTPLLIALFPSRLTRPGLLWGVIAFYGAAMAAEVLDRRVFSALGVVSGHTLKHLFAGAGMLFVAAGLRLRRPLPMLLLAAVFTAATGAGASAAPAPAPRPSRKPVKGCKWERLTDSLLGLEAWVQRCDFGSRKIDFVFEKNALAIRYSDAGGRPDPVVEVFDVRDGETPEAGIQRLWAERTPKFFQSRCALAAFREARPTPGAARYTFEPLPAYAADLKKKQDPSEVPPPPCGDWGTAPDGIQYWEAQPSGGSRKVLFVRVGQDEPLFDEKTLKLLPAK